MRLRPRFAGAAACVAALLMSFCLMLTEARAGTGHVDGVSDQSLPAWDGSFATSPFVGTFRDRWIGGPPAQITLARYVVQWNVMAEPSAGPAATGNYRERFEAWLQDARSMGLTPVLALTSYDEVRPRTPAEYRSALQEILGQASAMRYPIAYLEAWNEPNNQGREPAVTAAGFADAAAGLCEGLHSCRVIAGDFEDGSALPAYERAYEQALTFAPRIWGVHPYVSLQGHSDANLRRFKVNLPGGGAGQEIWFTEIGAMYCRHGEVRGEAQQAGDAVYLRDGLIADPVVAPAHVFYYGFLFAQRSLAPCAASGGDDSELYRPTGAPRAAASILLSPESAGFSPPAPSLAGEQVSGGRGRAGGGASLNPLLMGVSALIEALPSWKVEP